MPEDFVLLGPAPEEPILLGDAADFDTSIQLGPAPRQVLGATRQEKGIISGALSKGYLERVREEFAKMPGMAKSAFENPNPFMGLAEAANVVVQPAMSVLQPAIEPYVAQGLSLGSKALHGIGLPVKPQEAVDFPKATPIISSLIAGAAIPIPGLPATRATRLEKEIAEVVAVKAGARVPVIDPSTGETILKNPPASKAAQIDYLDELARKEIDITDEKAVAQHVLEREGLNAPVEVNVAPEMPISKTEMQPAGVEVQIEPGTPGEVATRIEHEVGSHVPEKLGLKSAPIEDNELLVSQGIQKERATFTEPVQEVSRPTAIPEEIRTDLIQSGVSKKVVDAAGELFLDGSLKRDHAMLISDQVMDAVSRGQVKLGHLEDILQKHDIGLEEFGRDMLRVRAGDAGRILQRYSRIQQLLNEAEGNGLGKLARVLDKEAGPWGRLYWRTQAVRDVWRSLLTSQFATAARNFQSQGVRFGIHALDRTLESGIQKLMGRKAQAAFHPDKVLSPLDGIEEFFSLVHGGRNKKLADELQKQVQEVNERLFTSYNSDISTKTISGMRPTDKALALAQKGAGVLNWANQAQEYMYRRAALISGLETRLGKVGQNLEGLVKGGKAADYFASPTGKKILDETISKALELSWAESPKFGTPMANLISIVNRVPGLSYIVPFPRFIYNSSKFFFEHSPFGLMKIMSPTERAAIASGDVGTYSKAITGTLMFGAAYAFRKSEYAGEKFYEAKTPGGMTVDLRPFNPYLAYFLVADWIVRDGEDRLQDMPILDLAATALSTNVRAGTGLYLLDQIGKLASNRANPEKISKMLKRTAGEIVGGFATPIQQLRDITAEFDEMLKIQKDTSEAPFTGPIERKLPSSFEHPEKESPTQEATPKDVSPLVKQVSGLRLQEPKNLVQKELDRLGISEYEVSPSSGDKDFDRIVNKYMGPLVEQELEYYIQTSEFQQMDNRQKVYHLKRALQKIHARAIKEAKSEDPTAYEAVREGRKPWFEKAMVEAHPEDVQVNDEDETLIPIETP